MKKLCVLLLLTACASSPQRAEDRVQVGMDKDKVLDVAGNPVHTFREHDEDHWVYQYFKDSEEWKREIIFVDGKVSRVGKPLSHEAWIGELQSTDSMEEFEKKAREHQKKADNFKAIDGQTEPPPPAMAAPAPVAVPTPASAPGK